jgi:8-oxo-dGTP pyrophosphatase MutT (NUDIX family)
MSPERRDRVSAAEASNNSKALRLAPVRTGAEVAVFVARRDASEVLILHRSPVQGGYWHVVAGGVETDEDPVTAARRELLEETGLDMAVSAGPRVVEYVDPLTEEPPDRREKYDPSLVEIEVSCFRCDAPEDWEPVLDWEHDDYRWCRVGEAVASLRWRGTAQALLKMLG